MAGLLGGNMIEKVLAERGGRYGHFRDNARVSAALRNIVIREMLERGTVNPDSPLGNTVLEGINQICGKLSRIACGDPQYDDNWRDIAGYATLVLQDIEASVDAMQGPDLGAAPPEVTQDHGQRIERYTNATEPIPYQYPDSSRAGTTHGGDRHGPGVRPRRS